MAENIPDTLALSQEGPDAQQSADIAIIGMAGRFPGARNIDEFWANLVAGEESIRRLSDEELLRAGASRRDLESPDYVKACPVLPDIDQFDAAFFGLSPRDASVMDPAHRFFLEVAWEALEHAGNTGLADEGRVGVFASSGAPLYWMNNVRSHREIVEAMGEFLVRHTGNDMNFLATRVSYNLDLRGPSINVQTACSSTLVAAHLARQSLLAGECDMALIGGSTIIVPQGQGYHYKEGEILSPDGHCRPFDHRSAGTVFGSGTACLVLKRLDDALDNGDTIHAVIKGAAVNNDGAVKVGYLAPGVEGQVDAIKKALAVARLNARSIGYVEAHGTGTLVGDPIELTALDQVYSEQTADKQFCGIGSVKSNIGHLGEAAAGASLIKAVLALKHRLLPPSLGYERPNPGFAMADSPFFVTATLKAWDHAGPLYAGVNALGAGGTNCHLILGEPPAMLAGEGARDQQLFVLSAKTRPALERMSENLAAHLQSQPSIDLADAAYTLAMGRRALAHRRVFVARDRAEAIGLLRGSAPTRVSTAAADASDPELVFTFPGGGAQYARMGFDLYETEPAYRAALDECLDILDREIDPALRALLFAAPAEAAAATRQLQQPAFALPALFAVEYALACLFQAWGLRPAACIGHSMGEYVAACLAGVFSLRDGLRLVHLRGRLFEATQPGKMVGVSLAEAATRALMPAGLSIAAVNAPELCVASGPSELIDAFSRQLTAADVDWTPIHIDVAAHSSLLDPILDEFRAFCRTIEFHPPQLPIASNLTGRWLSAAEATDPEYWVRHLRNTVRFADCVETVLAGGDRVFLEIGPGRTLTSLVGAQRTKVRHALSSVRHPQEAAHDGDHALYTLGKVWAAGAHVDWTALYDGQLRNRVALPSYPFETQSYWVAPKPVQLDVATEPVKRDNLDEWFAAAAWEQTPCVAGTNSMANRWLLLVGDPAFGQALRAEITGQSAGACDIVTVRAGPGLRRIDDSAFEVSPDAAAQYQSLLELLKNEGRAPEHVVLLPGFCAGGALVPGASRLATDYYAPVHLCQSVGAVLEAATITLVTENAFSVHGEALDPWARLNLGPALVMPRELPDFPTRLIDLCSSPKPPASRDAGVRQLARELLSGDAASPVVLRTPTRWTRHLRPTRLPAAPAAADWLADGDVVLITGGLGGIGLVLAEHLARTRKIRLALLSREGLPPRATWELALAAPATTPQLQRRIALVQGLENLGAQVLAVRADVSDAASLQAALAEVRSRLGAIAVVIHAAGIMDDAPLQTKSDKTMQRVLAPKVLGAINLDAAITEDLKAFVLMSSVASFLGLPGQIDYTAANAFLDAFAEDRQRRKAGRTLAINWNAWRDVGMVVDVERRAPETTLASRRTEHPWLDAVEETPTGRRYFTDFSVASHWLLSEHRITNADAVIPGTGFVELARAAYADAARQRAGGGPPSAAIELSQVTFLSPFQVGSEQTRRLQIDVEWHEGWASVALRSADGQQTHLTAEVRPCTVPRRSANLAELRARCPRSQPTRDGFLDQDFVRFGPRWQNLEHVGLGEGEAVIDLALREPYAAELGVLAYHPALLDMATGAAQTLIPGFRPGADFYVPFGYDRIRIYAPVGRTATSHVRLRPGAAAGVASFDVDLFDADGCELMSIEGFTMRRVDSRAAITQTAAAPPPTPKPKLNPAMEALLREAITQAEGVMAFDRALAQTELTQVVASSVDVNVWLRKLALDARRLRGAETGESAPNFARPALGSDYVRPEGALEIALATIWSKLLGVAEVGVLDDFFELGGNSLVAVRFFARVKKDFGVSLPLSTLFQAPTIRALAAALHDQGYQEAGAGPAAGAARQQPLAGASTPAVAPPSPTTAAAPPAKAPVAAPLLIRPGTGGRPPLFFVHDGLGEILLYRSLALRLDPGHAVYGLEPETSRGRYTHTRIVDMARAKVERIRSVQPNGPYLLAGLCAGGVIAFEIARQLQDAGERTLFVGLIDAADVAAKEKTLLTARSRVKRVLSALRPAENESFVAFLAGLPPTLWHKAANLVKYEIASRVQWARTADSVAALRGQAFDNAGRAPEIEYLAIYELAHKEHVAHGSFSGGDVVLFRATQGDGSLEDVPFRELYADPLMGWQQRVASSVHCIDVPGGHSSALQEPHVGILASEMRRCIDSALNKNSPAAPTLP